MKRSVRKRKPIFNRLWPPDVFRGAGWVFVKISTFLRLLGLSRLAFGLWLALAPQKPGELWFGGGAQSASTSALLRSVGARDVGLGLGLVADPRPGSSWLRAGILADVVDAAAAVLIRDRVPARNAMTGLIGAALYAVIGTIVAVRRSAENA